MRVKLVLDITRARSRFLRGNEAPESRIARLCVGRGKELLCRMMEIKTILECLRVRPGCCFGKLVEIDGVVVDFSP